MLPTQVQYWDLQERKRSNRTQEALKGRELDISQQQANVAAKKAEAEVYNAETNRMQYYTSKQKLDLDRESVALQSVNALTQQHLAQSQRMQAEASLRQATASENQANTQALKAQWDYDVGLRQSSASAASALAAQSSAQAALTNASVNNLRVQSEINKNMAAADYTQKQANTHYIEVGAEAAKDVSMGLGALGIGLPNIGKAAKSVFDDIRYAWNNRK